MDIPKSVDFKCTNIEAGSANVAKTWVELQIAYISEHRDFR
jgi:hypothetical protein